MRFDRAAAVGLGACAALVLPAAAAAQTYALERVFPEWRFTQPVALLPVPSAEGWAVVEQRGAIWRLRPDAEPTLFADLRRGIQDGAPEEGLLGMAFHPRFPEDPRVFLSFTRGGAVAPDSVIAAYRSNDDGETLDPATEQVVLSIPQPYSNHNGGHIAFGPDGFLYAGYGDGGAGGDPLGNGQDLGTLLGSLLRIDVDGAAPYAIPPDNPFADGLAGRAEIYAYGLRNPWRFSFDRVSGALWLADVGQSLWEEVNRVEPGGNYGWNVREGAHCFGANVCAEEGLIDPVAEYDHGVGCSVTGGFVYRGSSIPGLVGRYVYGDYCTGRIWAVSVEGGEPDLLLDTDVSMSTFGEGADGELYVVGHRSGNVFRLTAN
jgi:glucose/arabinose dehydrogenase